MTQSENKYYNTIFQQIKFKVKESENILQRFKFSQQMMENLINDLLDLAKLENNKFSMTNEFFNLQQTIYQALHMLQFMATQNGVELKAVIDKRIHLDLIQSIMGDERRFLQMLLNFLSNALKFTNKDGCITVKVDILEDQLVNESLSDKDDIQNLLAMDEIKLKNEGYKDLDDYVRKNVKMNHKSEKTYDIKEGQQRYLKLKLSVIDTGIGISE